jgi:exodeoxyribonuclease V beta subunit
VAQPREFHYCQVNLNRRALIEASAGTGKTYAIESLYLRLLLEKELNVGGILVVTFTEAATADLKRRILSRLQQAILAFQTGQSDDKVLQEELSRTADHGKALELLRAALHDFDRAAIHTIHAFCLRALQEHAFESSSLFDTQLVTDQTEVLVEIVRDYWRDAIYRVTPLIARCCLKQGFSPANLRQLAVRIVARPYLKIRPEESQVALRLSELMTVEARLHQVFESLSRAWTADGMEAIALLKAHDHLHQTWYKEEKIDRSSALMNEWIASGDVLGAESHTEIFSAGKIGKSVKSGTAPIHPIFDLYDEFLNARGAFENALNSWLLSLKVRLRCFCDNQLKARKTRRNERFFDDLLLDLYVALQGAAGAAFAGRLRDVYPAALIDEFQDTDPLQYCIFSRIYAHSQAGLFLIGDPKQAIYSFRSADVFAYLEASREVDEVWTLRQNWRSSERLIQATNALFRRAQDGVRPAFVVDGIEFTDAGSGNPEIGGDFLWNGRADEAPFKLWLVRRDNPFQFTQRAANECYVAGLVAAEIERLVRAGRNGTAILCSRRLTAGDIAVLVRTHKQAAGIQQALLERAIPCVLHTQRSVLKSAEALDLARVLAAVASPENDSKVKTALATALLGLPGDQLVAEYEDSARWEKRLMSFVSWRDHWLSGNFMKMARRWMAETGLRGRLLAAPDGARRMTNLLHCLELLNQAILQEGLGMEGALKWLAEGRMDHDGAAGEERQLRLESDDAAVQVITLHVSKGLEFPIVFCPFNWQVSDPGADYSGLSYHDPSDAFRLVRDLTPEPSESAKSQADRERLAEDVRLLYVGLTRAKYRCTLIWGGFRNAHKSALAHLLHPGRPLHFKASSMDKQPATEDDQLLADLRALQLNARQTIELVEIPLLNPDEDTPVSEASVQAPLILRKWRQSIPRDWGITSYSALTSGHRRQEERPDRDETGAIPVPPVDAALPESDRSFLEFPGGALIGTLLHEILEAVDFSDTYGETTRLLVEAKLASQSLSTAWADPVLRMLAEISRAQLGRGAETFSLGEVNRKDRITELEFALPLENASAGRLREVFRRHDSPAMRENLPDLLEKIEFIPSRGLLKGFIDAVVRHRDRYYLIDWKSNLLGYRPEDYGVDKLHETMAAEYYFLQYHLYAVALHRFLAHRLGAGGYCYGRDFGGAIYLFLRGVRKDWGDASGIFQDRPDEKLILELDRSIFQMPEAGP